jgi:hypothetical protein
MKALGARAVPIPDGIDVFHLKEEIEASDTVTALEAVMSVDEERNRLEKEAEKLNDVLSSLTEKDTSDGGADGGDGEFSDITGTNLIYAGGGAGEGGGSSPGAGHDRPGGGGTMAGGVTSGQNGILIFRYTLADVTHSYTGGVITNVGGDRIHTFTSNGKLSPLVPSVGAFML